MPGRTGGTRAIRISCPKRSVHSLVCLLPPPSVGLAVANCAFTFGARIIYRALVPDIYCRIFPRPPTRLIDRKLRKLELLRPCRHQGRVSTPGPIAVSWSLVPGLGGDRGSLFSDIHFLAGGSFPTSIRQRVESSSTAACWRKLPPDAAVSAPQTQANSVFTLILTLRPSSVLCHSSSSPCFRQGLEGDLVQVVYPVMYLLYRLEDVQLHLGEANISFTLRHPGHPGPPRTLQLCVQVRVPLVPPPDLGAPAAAELRLMAQPGRFSRPPLDGRTCRQIHGTPRWDVGETH